MKLKTRLVVTFLVYSILPLVFIGIFISVSKAFLVYRFDDFSPDVQSMVIQMLVVSVSLIIR